MTKPVVDTRDHTWSKEERLMKEIRDNLRRCVEVEDANRKEAIEDLNMLAGRGHWPASIVAKRTAEDRPVLIVNKLPAFTDQVKNDARLNELSINVRPYGYGATVELAQTYEDLIRNIENVSHAHSAYQTGIESAIDNGFGYFRVITEYMDDDAVEQEILIKRIRNPMTVYLDPYHQEFDSRDKRFAFITEMVSRSEYKIRYPKRDLVQFDQLTTTDQSVWCDADMIRIAEYWVLEPYEKTIYLLSDKRVVQALEWDSIKDDLKAAETMIHLEPNPQDPEGEPIEVEGPAPEGSGYPQMVVNPTPTIVKTRKVKTHKVMQYLVDGQGIIDGPTEWAGRYIPIIPVWGKETVVNDERILRGLIRFAKDPQRMYNYFRTAATETVALTPKAPYIMEEGQIEGHESEWQNVGKTNKPYLLYKAVSGVSTPPMRQIVTQTALGEITECNLANDEMKATTSIYDASLGNRSNEVSGKAITARMRGADIANFVFHDNLKRALEFTGDILVDLIPKIYDTDRQIMVLNKLGEDKTIFVNQAVIDVATGKEVIINDLSVGKYKVIIKTGPSFTTQRIEAAESMMDFVRTSPQTAELVMDLIAENQDWPGAGKIAKRLKKILDMKMPGIDDDGPPPPPQPNIDDEIKIKKHESITLGNQLKGLTVVEKRRELTGHDEDMLKAGAMGALQAVDQQLGGGNNGRQGQVT